MSGIIGSIGVKSSEIGHTNAGTLGSGVGFTALVGTIAPHSSATLPAGWLNADGSAVSRTTYVALLFALLPITYYSKLSTRIKYVFISFLIGIATVIFFPNVLFDQIIFFW